MQGATHCDFCKRFISTMKRKPTGHVSLDLEPFNQVVSSTCTRHRPLLEKITSWLDLQEGVTEPLHLFRNYFDYSVSFSLKDNYGQSSPSLDVLESPDGKQFVGYGIQLDPSWINHKTLIRWYDTCTSGHGNRCSKPEYLGYLPKPELRILIDVTENCLTPAPENASYMALSYVWGKVDMPKTVTANLSQLQKLGALNNTVLPKTIRHAMYLTRLLGERYLWVDSLCIVQDDEEFLNGHLGRMASIFAHAQAVIVPIDGENAESGIPGLEEAPAAQPRHLEQETIPFGERSLLIRTKMGLRGRGESSSKKADYFDRGWTFQEYLFARRRICFENSSVWFQCCQSTQYEDHSHPDLPDRNRDFLLDVGYPSLTVFSRLVEDFNQRQLSYPQDCLAAIAGMLPCYSRAFKGGFLCGLPEMFFDATLLWQPGDDLVRRVPVDTGTTCGGINSGSLPTWSWVGWQGRLDFAGWATGNDFVAACSGWIASSRQQIIPITKWFTSSDVTGRTCKRPVEVEWALWRDRHKDPKCPLPSGWTRRRRRKGESLTIEEFPDGFGEYLYKHESCAARFWYPIPLSDPDYPHQQKVSSFSEATYLFGSVQTAHLSASGAVWTHEEITSMGPVNPSTAHVSMRTSQNEWAGVIRLHSRDHFERQGLDPAKSPVELQLIAISRGFIANGLESYVAREIPEYVLEERPKAGEKYEFYNIMWISWRNGIAYREGLGRVHKDKWDSLQVSSIDIVLG